MLGDHLVSVTYLALLRVCDGSVRAKDCLHEAQSIHNMLLEHARSHPDKIVVGLSTARTSSTQREASKHANVDKAWQHQSGILAKFTGQDSPTKKWYAQPETQGDTRVDATLPSQPSLPDLVLWVPDCKVV